jgi:hypothetical protein
MEGLGAGLPSKFVVVPCARRGAVIIGSAISGDICLAVVEDVLSGLSPSGSPRAPGTAKQTQVNNQRSLGHSGIACELRPLVVRRGWH